MGNEDERIFFIRCKNINYKMVRILVILNWDFVFINRYFEEWEKVIVDLVGYFELKIF